MNTAKHKSGKKKQGTTKRSNLLFGSKRITARTRKLIVLTCSVLLFLGLITVMQSQASQEPKQNSGAKPSSQGIATEKPTTMNLRIESNVPGVTVQGDPHCDGAKLAKVTPFDCELSSDVTETVITAPAEIESDGVKYVFESWDGCSEGNEDHKVCKVTLQAGVGKQLNATYAPYSAPKPVANSPATTPPPAATPQAPAYKNLSEQCEDSKVVDEVEGTVKCTVTSDALMLGIGWSGNPKPTTQPPITVECLSTNQVDCGVGFTIAPEGENDLIIPRGTSAVVNGDYIIGRQNPGPEYPTHFIGGLQNDFGYSRDVSVTLFAPLSHTSDGITYTFKDYFIYVPGTIRAGTTSDYFNWNYDKK